MAFILATLVFLGLIFLLLRLDEDTWICDNGAWVKHGNPSASMPTSECK